MMYPDIENAIKLIDAKIEELRQAKKTLLEAFPRIVDLASDISRKSQVGRSKLITKKNKPTRKDELIKLLENEGPLSRGEILKKTGFPQGTIAYLLNDKTTFFSKNGRWHLIRVEESQRDEKEKGLTEAQ